MDFRSSHKKDKVHAPTRMQKQNRKNINQNKIKQHKNKKNNNKTTKRLVMCSC